MAQPQPNALFLYLEPLPSGGYLATCPDVPGLVVEGATRDEILRNFRDELGATMAVWAQLGLQISPGAALRAGRARNRGPFAVPGVTRAAPSATRGWRA